MAKPIKVLRWTLTMAASEIPTIARETLAKRLKALDIQPGEDGMFSTGQILRAAFGDIESERKRKVTGEADKIELDNAKTKGELVEVVVVKSNWDDVALITKQGITNMCQRLKAGYFVGMPAEQFNKHIDDSEYDLLSGLSAKE